MRTGATLVLAFAGAILCATPALSQQGATGQLDGPMTENPRYKQKPQEQKSPQNQPAPRSDDESSSEQTRVDLSPPKEDARAHPDGGQVANDVMEFHEWNPMRAMKDVEVGDYYYKAANYKAALSRYREALLYKPHDAVATFKLAQTLEKVKEYDEARIRYGEYLAILKDGPSAGEAKKALERLKKQP